MISKPDSMRAIELISEVIQGGVTQEKTCLEIGISDRTYQRWVEELETCEDKRSNAKRKEPQNKLSRDEFAIIETYNQPKYHSLPPSQIVPKLADKKYICVRIDLLQSIVEI